MRKLILITFLAYLGQGLAYSQIIFEQGYFIDNDGKKTECYIKNLDWKNNPTKFEYKLAATGDILHASIKTVKEFGVAPRIKYQRFTVEIDKTPSQLSDLDQNRSYKFEKATLFLKPLVEGMANLYLYEAPKFRKYFFSVDGLSIEQLRYKQYYAEEGNIGENEAYKQQLIAYMPSANISKVEIMKLDYKENDLIRIFNKYNREETGGEYVEKEVEKTLTSFKVKVGLEYSSLKIDSYLVPNKLYDLGSTESMWLGGEFEVVLPFNKNKWSLLVEPAFKSMKFQTSEGKAVYQSFDLAFGPNTYFHLSEKSKLFLRGGAVLGFTLNGDNQVEVSRPLKLDLTEVKGSFFWGCGFAFDKLSIELRRNSRGVLDNYNDWASKLTSTGFILGYRL
ncbi:hypothetical protein R9C00_02170 [Flammeovirgaceae bacterium SG7u.111]|nr:hypothetical protein [Flammeovirgaceae bacterium SG7u.132]WPO36248.1 hypothetical protein R9C00_02170 [Flammeovirgaceae bacterium SG7u.111]